MHPQETHRIRSESVIFANRLGSLRLFLHFVVNYCENKASLQSSQVLVKNASLTVRKFYCNSVLLASVAQLN